MNYDDITSFVFILLHTQVKMFRNVYFCFETVQSYFKNVF